MKKYPVLAAFCGLFALTAAPSPAGDWVTAPSYFSHDPHTGQRVRQYAPIGPFYTQAQGNYRRSGYHHTRSSIQVGTSADNYHIVEEYGAPVRPYGEWRFPYRPFSVPAHLSTPHFVGPGFGGFPGGFPGGRGRFPVGRRGFPNAGGGGPRIPVPPAAGPGSGVGQPGAGLFDLHPEREGHHLPFNTPDTFQREQLLPSDPPPLPR